jgi:hypothetical protein
MVRTVQHPVNSALYVLSNEHSDHTIKDAAMTDQAESSMNHPTSKEEAPPPLHPLPPGEGKKLFTGSAHLFRKRENTI